MGQDKTWEEETLELLEAARARKHKAEQRLLSAQRAVESADEDISALQKVLGFYRTQYGLPSAEVTVDPEVAAEYQDKSAKEMLHLWADKHHGELAMNEAAHFLAAAGLFTDPLQAAGTLYPTIRRMPEFRRAKRGLYIRTAPEVQRQIQLPRETTEPAKKAPSLNPATFTNETNEEDVMMEPDDLPF